MYNIFKDKIFLVGSDRSNKITIQKVQTFLL